MNAIRARWMSANDVQGAQIRGQMISPLAPRRFIPASLSSELAKLSGIDSLGNRLEGHVHPGDDMGKFD